MLKSKILLEVMIKMEIIYIITGIIALFLLILNLVSFYFIYIFYQKTEKQRVEITKLVREISYLKSGSKKN